MNVLEQMIKTFGAPPALKTFEHDGKSIDIYIKKITLLENDAVIERVGEMPKLENAMAALQWTSVTKREICKVCLVDEKGNRCFQKDSDFNKFAKELGRDVVNALIEFVWSFATDAEKRPAPPENQEQTSEADEGDQKND